MDLSGWVNICGCLLKEEEINCCAEKALEEIMKGLPEQALRVDVISEVIETMKVKLRAARLAISRE